MSSGAIFVLVLLVLFLIWLMVVRPQRRRQLNQEAMIDHLRIGDEVLTAGGIFATVVRIEEDEVTVELSPGAEARVAKRAIAAIMPDDDAERELQAGPEAAEPSEPVGEKPS
jgi:preprotein translocase subunit YajC